MQPEPPPSSMVSAEAIAKEGISALLSDNAEKLLFDEYCPEAKKPPLPRVPSSLRSLPIRSDIAHILADERESLRFMEALGVFETPKNCPSCGGNLRPMATKMTDKSRFVVRCRARKCPTPFRKSIFAYSVLSHCKFEKNKFVEFAYLWLMGIPAGKMRGILGLQGWVVTNWCNYLREAVASDILMNDECQIGGPGIVVEMDESKFGKRKYHVSAAPLQQLFFGRVTHSLPFDFRRKAKELRAVGCLVVASGLSPIRKTPSRRRTSVELDVGWEKCLL